MTSKFLTQKGSKDSQSRNDRKYPVNRSSREDFERGKERRKQNFGASDQNTGPTNLRSSRDFANGPPENNQVIRFAEAAKTARVNRNKDQAREAVVQTAKAQSSKPVLGETQITEIIGKLVTQFLNDNEISQVDV